ncbi:SusC/RagA family TonB-linked outer membrane protein [Mucilaginibacter segetis]|uniref:TonB-dependent receptor n=1 Tax=Mucilaginibacter segetis TaxID=2793071 RepID=A0A934UM90_9SPHI|nr:TonB-dependent receptor [Mucilaginibacter segetis]MBK0378637.1 TonB-dependent receptor [Mucilaginibacter segetis]
MFKSLLLKGRTLCLLLCCMVSSLVVTAQTKHTGKVIGSDDKLPVVGATVLVKGTTTGTQTDVNGQFSLNVSPGDVLVVSYLGYTSQEITVGTSNVINVTLQAGNNTLDEVVVTGYTSQRKKDISGAVATVDVASAIKLPASSSDQLLQGQASGVTVVTQGSPGAGAQVQVRGIANFGNSSPLIVIDGVQGGNLSNLNPNDIESISVLKDAGSAAIYGISGGNGVVVVTTKKGKAGKTTFTYDMYYGTQRPLGGNPFNTLNARDYEALVKQVDPGNALLINGEFQDYGFQSASVKGVGPATDPRANPANYKFDEFNPANDYLIQKFDNENGTDWFHEVFKPAPLQSHTISASGANDKNTYYASFGYLNQQGTLIETYFKRVQARINTTFSINDHFRVGENANLFYTLSPNGQGSIPSGNQNEGNSISEIYRIEPQIPVYDIAGNYGGTYAGPTQLGNAVNPVATQERQKYNMHKNWTIEGTVFAEADFLKHFTARTAFSGHIENQYNTDIGYRPYDSGEGHGGNNSFTEYSRYQNYYNWSNTINYNQIFGKHNVKFLAGFEQKQYGSRELGSTVVNLPSLDPAFVTISGGTATSAPYSTNFQPTASLSYFGRLDYIYDDRYILSATVRRDGSSVFATGRNYGTFPSVSLAWRISQEEFLKGVSWLNDLKLRGSYGTLGYQGNVGGANAFTLFGLDKGSSFYAIDGSSNNTTQGFFNSSIGNGKTHWETDKILNIGFDITLFNKLDVTAEYYKKTSANLLYTPSLPATVGGASPPAVNVGEVQNKGVDISVSYRDRISNDLSFNLGLNVTTYKNEITKAPYSFTQVGSRIGDIIKQTVGHPIGSFYGYDVIGYFKDAADVAVSPTQADAAPGRFKYKDLDGDGVITDADRDYFGKGSPDFTYGLNVGLNFKKFDFSMIFYGSQGNDNFNYVKYWTNFYSSLTGNKGNDLLKNSWSPTNLNPATPIAEASSNFSTSGVVNSYYLENGSFLKCRSAQLGYTFGADQLKAIGVSGLNVYIQATNLFTITKYTGLDPELQAVTGNSTGVDFGNYPSNERKFLVGARLSF